MRVVRRRTRFSGADTRNKASNLGLKEKPLGVKIVDFCVSDSVSPGFRLKGIWLFCRFQKGFLGVQWATWDV